MSKVPNLTLNNGVEIPQLGFGVFQVPPEEARQTVATALRTGYRSIDTAKAYSNESGVGQAVAESGLPREDVFVTTKLLNAEQGYDSTLRAFDASMTELGLDYLDLYLIHWPLPGRDLYVETWKAFERLYGEGRVRAIGVSNFTIDHLKRLFDETELVPSINQVELHPKLQQPELRAFHAEHGILTEAWSPLAQGEVLADPVVTRLAEKHGRTPAQVILRWHLDIGNVVIPKSVTPSRIEENFDLFDFHLDPEDVESLAPLDSGTRVLGLDPATFNG
ncbi:oxidoreductase [Actinoalloteichus sp. AHMU CJ021]|uniref:Aldo/keto reductase n=1 Tax=Actinoalloteichus caeruleus DSM 43889 TaxID=1120930 RepID=A0ABT1JKI6_ACTCY|nr:aldo/keto reductase [Actinoalloteichus caeruleus]AUS78669.1 oxidoreductase [Actinoalloteichus sp. AHMU CJ021]MCP2332809.1 Aldo/keto reductase [Actinoalloteichus caeruleus DSM 43889]